MTGPFFVDTNVLVYAEDPRNPAKQSSAKELLRRAFDKRTGRISTQVLNEFFSVAVRKLGLTSRDARGRVELYSRLDVVTPSVDDVLGAIDLHRLYDFEIWDALIVRAAQISGCTQLYTEDLQHGQRIDSLEIVNPFA